MKIVFISNYYNCHQHPLCQNLHRMLGEDFTFIATEITNPARLTQGYSDMNNQYSYVLRAYESVEAQHRAQKMVDEADVVIFGSAPWSYLQERLRQNKLTFLYSERLYKTGYEAWKWPVRMIRFYRNYGRFKKLYLLCASAYAAADYGKTFTFINKAYKWGYFPETRRYADFNNIMKAKETNTILWAARFLDWKHPEHVVQIARRLKQEGYAFRITMLGSGELLERVRSLVEAEKLDDCIELLGAVPAEDVRGYMEKAQIFLVTSDRNEGWGAVLNESMNSGCAVVACDAIGSVPFLLQDNENGFIYPSSDTSALYKKVKVLLDNPRISNEMGRRAYESITGQWNAETATHRLLELSQALLAGESQPDLYEYGPCSKADILRDSK